MRLNSGKVFLQSAVQDFKRTGAVAPSTRALARAMNSELVCKYRSDASVLEVGGGTGSITKEIVRNLGPRNQLDVFEIDPRFAGLLRERVRRDEGFINPGAAIRIYNKGIESINPARRYDFIISCLPFTNFEPQMVQRIFEIYRTILKPNGICSFYEYVFMRNAARIISGKPSERERVTGVANVVREYVVRYSYKREIVLRNLPPAVVYHLRFDYES
jgi:phosphatidylethanolamine/phosphatidyl-N-methylethanolamine N-methyltransferase